MSGHLPAEDMYAVVAHVCRDGRSERLASTFDRVVGALQRAIQHPNDDKSTERVVQSVRLLMYEMQETQSKLWHPDQAEFLKRLSMGKLGQQGLLVLDDAREQTTGNPSKFALRLQELKNEVSEAFRTAFSLKVALEPFVPKTLLDRLVVTLPLPEGQTLANKASDAVEMWELTLSALAEYVGAERHEATVTGVRRGSAIIEGVLSSLIAGALLMIASWVAKKARQRSDARKLLEDLGGAEPIPYNKPALEAEARKVVATIPPAADLDKGRANELVIQLTSAALGLERVVEAGGSIDIRLNSKRDGNEVITRLHTQVTEIRQLQAPGEPVAELQASYGEHTEDEAARSE